MARARILDAAWVVKNQHSVMLPILPFDEMDYSSALRRFCNLLITKIQLMREEAAESGRGKSGYMRNAMAQDARSCPVQLTKTSQPEALH